MKLSNCVIQTKSEKRVYRCKECQGIVLGRSCCRSGQFDKRGLWKRRCKGIGVRVSHTRYRAMGSELIPVYRQSARKWLLSHPSDRLPLLSARPAVTFQAEERHSPSTNTKLSYTAWWQANRCEQLVKQLCPNGNWTHDLLNALLLYHCATLGESRWNGRMCWRKRGWGKKTSVFFMEADQDYIVFDVIGKLSLTANSQWQVEGWVVRWWGNEGTQGNEADG